MVILQYNMIDIEASINFWKLVQDLGPTVVSIAAIIVTLIVTKQTLKTQTNQNLKTLNAQKEFEARQVIQRKLDEFYGPLIQQRIKSSKLYEKFSAKYKDKDKNFSTLLYLLNGFQFTGNDKVLLEQIIQLGEESERLIQEKAGLIDDTELRIDIIPRATTHFLLIKLAYNRKLIGESTEFNDLTFPRELLNKLEERKNNLEKELQKLNRKEN